MTNLPYSLIFSVLSTLFGAALAIDRWVHSVSGPSPISARLADVEDKAKRYDDVELDLRELRAVVGGMKEAASSLERRVAAMEHTRRE